MKTQSRYTNNPRTRRTHPFRMLFAAMTMVLLVSGTVSPIMPLLQVSPDAAAAQSAGDLPDPPQLGEPIQIDPPDGDQDGIPDSQDTCPKFPNVGSDWDADGVDDACDPPPRDSDQDGIPDPDDSCPKLQNIGSDWDGDGVDDACDPPPTDTDNDGIPDPDDSCPNIANTGSDWNGDGSDDACDPPPTDADNDGIPDPDDSCPNIANTGSDWNGDGSDDACDPQPIDTDNDGIPDPDDSCPNIANAGSDWNGDGSDDACDPPPPDDGNSKIPEPLRVPREVELQEYIYVELKWCPAGTDLSTYPEDGEGPGSICSETGHDTTVVLESTTDPANNTSIAVPAATGYAEFRPIPIDIWELHIESSVPLSAESLHCASFNLMGNTKPYGSALFALTEDNPWKIYDLETKDGEYTYCYWYGVQAPPTGDLRLTKLECPTTPEPGATFSWYMDNCDIPMEGIDFTLKSPPAPDVTGTTNADGEMFIPGVPPGPYELHEDVPAGYMPLTLLCRDVNRGTGMLITPTDVAITGNYAEIMIPLDMFLDCYWFNINIDADNGPGDLKLMKYECPSAAPAASTYEWYRDNCSTTMDGVKFTLDMPDPDPDISTSTNDTGTSGYIQMLGQNPGTYPLIEEVPTGYTPLALYCADVPIDGMPADSDFAPVSLSGSTASITINANRLLYCHWYNVPEDDENDEGTITIFKLECPADTSSDADMIWLSDNCITPMEGVDFSLTHGIDSFLLTTDNSGKASHAIGAGNIVVSELVPEGYSPNPMSVCGFEIFDDSGLPVAGMPAKVEITNAMWTFDVPTNNTDIVCYWFNTPIPDSTVTIHKFECPEGMPAEMTREWFDANCLTPMDGVAFDVTDSKGTRQKITSAGAAQWTDVATGKVQITEHVPDGYHPNPFVVCTTYNPDGTDDGTITPDTVNGVWNTSIVTPGAEISCNWYNWYLGPGEITVHKLTCPEGYDRTAWGADPMTECTDETDGVTFKLDQPDPEVDIFSDTGDSVPGAVYFGGLEPGDYTLTEMLDPATTMQDIFVWQCVGLKTSSVHPVPLSVGEQLSFTITAGDSIVCHWFNVPAPEFGWMEVHKYNCTTEKYVADVYCYTNQTGQEFNLQIWDGSTWVTVQSGVTNVSGQLTFTNLDAGAYRLIEPGTEACLMKSSNITPGGSLGVTTGEGTTVYVYNCETPPPPQKTPTKYPNTGVGSAAKGDLSWTPGLSIAGVIGLLGTQLNRRRLVSSAGLMAASTLPLGMAQQIVPLSDESTPVSGTPEPGVFWCATPTSSTPEVSDIPSVDPCNRGAIPIQMRIPVIGVDAPIEYLEIIDGHMQQPTGDTHITWYKETSRLGEVGNGIYAAHVNWYGNPEGIFFRLKSLQEGDVIEIDGDDQQTLLYEVQWTQNFPSDEAPPEEALGITNSAVITLITCGGEWSSALSEYDQRTLVRAVLRE